MHIPSSQLKYDGGSFFKLLDFVYSSTATIHIVFINPRILFLFLYLCMVLVIVYRIEANVCYFAVEIVVHFIKNES